MCYVFLPRPDEETATLSDELLLKSSTLFFVLLNPFLRSIYLLDLITDLKTEVFARVRGAPISSVVFCLFSWGGGRGHLFRLPARTRCPLG